MSVTRRHETHSRSLWLNMGDSDTDQHLWDYICGITEIQDGQISKEEVHGGWEMVIWERQQDDGLISHEGHSVEEKDNPRDHHLDLRLPCESKECKTTEVAIIDHSVFFLREILKL
ncbi:uncharacterized protein LOC112622550 [Theropithecus gelada]|uniref:uncharacterized protein LOC112622550 n=1 Tax=Theropithecus gelada TaxID=9565 RepID=UPI000DC16503|nr:uncharacterized protein LOC112622550 [Theropithecus gelada]